MTFLDLSESDKAHLRRALAIYKRTCRDDGIRLPLTLAELLDALTATNRQEASSLDDVAVSSDNDAMSVSVLLPYDEAGRHLSVSTRTVERLVAQGELPAVRVGSKTRRIHRADLDAYAASLRRKDNDGKDIKDH